MPTMSSGTHGLIVHSEAPFNAEPPLGRLRRSFITDVSDFYVRSHGDTPDLGAGTHAVAVTGLVDTPLHLTVADLKARFPARAVVAVLQCAGNRRADLQSVRPTSGDPWAPGAIGNAEWCGTSLIDVLRAARAQVDPHLHVHFESVDIAFNDGAPDAAFGVSIPISKALDPDVLIAWAMNGQPLTRDHGAPLRVVVPGFAGVRSAKWLRTVAVRAEPSRAFQQARDYLLFPPDIRSETMDGAHGVAITAMPLNAAICEPERDATLPAGPTRVRGYAIATDRAVVRVDVSSNGGRDWVQATTEENGQGRWSWTLWHATLMLPRGDHELVVRGWDAAGQTQPARPEEVWNCKGYLSAAWHRVRVRTA